MASTEERLKVGARLNEIQEELMEIFGDLEAKGYNTARLKIAIANHARAYHANQTMCKLYDQEMDILANLPPRPLSKK